MTTEKRKLFVTAVLLAVLLVLAMFAYNRLKSSSGSAGHMTGLDGVAESSGETAEVAVSKTAEALSADENNAETESQTEAERLEAVDFTVYDAEGNAVSLSSLEGKITIVNFWATWCGFCVQEMPDFQKIYDEYGDQINMMMVNVTDGQRETKESAMAYVEEKGYTFPVYYDTDSSASYSYGVNALPTTLLISADGYIAAYANGAIRYESLKQALDDRLETEPE